MIMQMMRTAASLLIMLSVLSASLAISYGVDGAGELASDEFDSLAVTRTYVQDIMGGGEFIGIRTSDGDSMIGVLFGTDENPNFVHVVSLYTRYLGMADVYDQEGQKLMSDRAMPVRTIYSQKFNMLYEFNDVNGDGAWDSRRLEARGEEETDDGSDEVPLNEPVFKKASLKTAWTPSEVVMDDHENGTSTWSVKLTTTALRYVTPLLEVPITREIVVDRVELTFHFSLTREDVEMDVPVYRVTASSGTGTERVLRSDPDGQRTYRGTSLSAGTKYDQRINGWDFSPRNRNPGLVLSTEVIFATDYNSRVYEWLDSEMLSELGRGVVSFKTSDGSRTLSEENSEEYEGDDGAISETIQDPRIVMENQLSISDAWNRVGRLTWVSEVDVDGRAGEAYFQVFMARRVSHQTAGGAVFRGIGIIAGFSFPVGREIFHDPTYEISSFTPEGKGGPNHVLLTRAVILIAAVSIVVISLLMGVLILVAVAEKRGKGQPHVERTPEDEKEYYDSFYMDDSSGKG